MADMEKAVRRFNKYCKDVKRMKDTVLKVQAGTLLLEEADMPVVVETLDAREKDLAATITEITEVSNDEELHDRMDETERDLRKTRMLARKLLKDVQTVQPATSRAGQVDRNLLSLPKISLPVFSGIHTEWLSFWGAFKSIDEDNNLSVAYKYSYLVGQLRGDALKMIDGFDHNEENYKAALAVLQKKYGDPDRLKRAYYQQMLTMSSPTASASAMKKFQQDLEYNLRQFDALNRGCLQNELFTRVWLEVLVLKLPKQIYDNMMVRKGGEINSMDVFRAELDKEVMRLESRSAVDERTTDNTRLISKPRDTKPQHQRATALSVNESSFGGCRLCDGNHVMFKCNKYNDREKIEARVKELKMCFKCLRTGHMSADCKNEGKCRQCGDRRHHGLLCRRTEQSWRKPGSTSTAQGATSSWCVDSRRVGPSAGKVIPTRPGRMNEPGPTVFVGHRTTQSNGDSDSQDERRALTKSNSGSLALPTARLTLQSPQGESKARALFDLGSQATFILDSVVKRAGIPITKHVWKSIDGFGIRGTRKSYPVAEVKVLIPGETIKFEAVVVDSLPSRIQTPGLARVAAEWRRLGEAMADTFVEGESISVDVLIGVGHFALFMGWPKVAGVPVMRSKLGSMPVGPIPGAEGESSVAAEVVTVLKVSVNADVDKLWRLDNIGINVDEAHPDHDSALETFNQSIRHEGDHYVARLPWKACHPALPDNCGQARGRLKNNLNHLRTKPDKLAAYDSVLREQLEHNFIEKVTPETKVGDVGIHYLSHHAVVKDSPTTPVRIVFDCSAKSRRGGVSLNDCLYSGPNLVPELTQILMRFRMNKFAVTADIKKAFLMIELDERDRDVTRFFWPDDPSDPASKVSVYRFRVVLFGATCSQFILNATIQHHLSRCPEEDRVIARQVGRNIYVDNVFATASEEESVVDFFENATRILKDAGLPLREWATNARSARQEMGMTGGLDGREEVPVLGLRWHTDSDRIHLASQSGKAEALTKRGLLSCLASQYDPLGLMVPVTIRGKMLMQEIWKRQLDWDDPLPEDIIATWTPISHDLSTLNTVSIDRSVVDTGEVTVHAFADASERALGAAVYFVQGGRSKLVIAKGRVVPLKALTVPKLEMTAMVLAARLLNYTMAAFSQELKFAEVHMWSDNLTCLRQLNSDKVLPAYVQNRINEICRRVPDAKWHHIPTDQNPADIPTRGCTVDELKESRLWWHGPEEVLLKYPLPPELPVINRREQTTSAVVVGGQDEFWMDPLINRMGSYYKIVRTLAIVKKCCQRWRGVERDKNRLSRVVDAQEYAEAERCLTQQLQKTSFPTVVNALDERPGRMAKLGQLRIRVRDGLLVCHTRLDNAAIPESAKLPILLPSKHRLTSLMIREMHCAQMHAGVSSLLAHIRQRYWIPQGRQRVKTVVTKCVSCRRQDGLAYARPEAPPLPTVRVQESPPFSATGVDYAGPFTVRVRGGPRETRYVALFTCASTRAVHIEIADGLSAEDFLHVFDRFVSRRGYPKVIISDNATNFTSVAGILQGWQESAAVQEQLNTHECKWLFIPSRAPWFGGFYERLIGMTKMALKKAVGRALLTNQELQTVMTQIERVLNDRPLTYVSNNPDDATPLTPSMLMHGRRLDSLPTPVVDPETIDDPSVLDRSELTGRMARHRLILQHCWQRWQREYLTMLRQEGRKRGAAVAPSVGEVVLIQDEGPRLMWQLGKIIELLPGRDDHVRVARVKTAKGVLMRAIAKLYPLELSAEPGVLGGGQDPSTEGLDSSGRGTDLVTEDGVIEPPQEPAADEGESATTESNPTRGRRWLDRGQHSNACGRGVREVPQRGAARRAEVRISEMSAPLSPGNV